MKAVPSSPYVICLGDAERAELESLSRRAAGAAPVSAARADRAAGGWRGREQRDRPAAGHLRGYGPQMAAPVPRRRAWTGCAMLRVPAGRACSPPRVVAAVKALACEMPAASGTPLARWTVPGTGPQGRQATASSLLPRRRLCAAGWPGTRSEPWQHRSWIFPRDPHFAVKASRVLDLYQREWEGQPLGEDEYVISADEKPGVQARMRIHPPLPPGPRRAMRAESEYRRYGTLAYLAAYDVHRARVFGRCEPSTGIKPFTALADQVMSGRAVRVGETGVLGRGQRSLAPELGRGSPPQRRIPERADGAPARPCVLAEPGRDLLLRHPAQAAHPRRLRGPRRARRARSSPSRSTTTP